MSSYVCPKHGDFISAQLLKEHMLAEHGVKFENEPSPELAEQIKRIEEKKNTPPIPTPVVASQPTVAIITKQPLRLEYIWTGNCPLCFGNNIKTIILKTNRTYVACCYCLTCSKDIAQKIIKPLEEKEAKNGSSSIETHLPLTEKVRKVRKATDVPLRDKA